MALQADITELAVQVPFVPFVTLAPSGEPHMIVCGRIAEVRADENTLVFKVAVMKKTQANLAANPYMQVVLALRGATPRDCKGFRLTGTGRVAEGNLLFQVQKAESLI